MKLSIIASLLISVIFVAADFAERFSVSPQKNNNSKAAFNINKQIHLPQLTPQQINTLTLAYNQYQPDPIVEVEKIVGLTAAEQRLQSGELQEFYLGEWRYRLLAVIFPDGSKQALKVPMALLKASTVKNKKEEVKIEKVYHNSVLANYKVAITDIKQVKLQYNQQNITLLMYQPKKNKNGS